MEKAIPIDEGEYTIKKLPEIYRVTEPLRGYAIIINNYKFKKLTNLDGGEEDSERLEKTFKGLRFEVDLRENKSADEMKNIFNQYGERNHSEYGCFVCVLSSHGGQEKIYGSDDKPVSIYDLIRVIISCSSLKEKPKLFFIDACRNSGKDRFVIDELTGCKDCFICFSTLAGSSATMMANLPWKGSKFLKVFCDIFRKYGEDVDLLRLLVKLKNAGGDITKNSQTVEIRDCLSKSVVFTTGWWVCHECQGLSKTNKCMTRTCFVYKDERHEADTEELRQMLHDFSGDLYDWISQTHEIVEELNLLSKDLDEHFRNINIAKVSGAAGAIAGGIMTVVGLILIPFTFGGSLALSVAGKPTTDYAI